MSRRRNRSECRRREPSFTQEKKFFARYGREGFRQCSFYEATFDPGEEGKIWRQEKKNCMSLGENFREEE